MKTEKGYQRGRGRGTQGSGEVRIIAGTLRGHRIPVAPRPGLRPTPGRSRETLFNWLRADLEGARILDAFAGSGALGLEALSRGAAEVTFIEKDRRAAQTLQETLQRLGGPQTHLKERDALAVLREAQLGPFDLVFLDPPFASSLAQAALEILCAGPLLAPGAKIYLELPQKAEPSLPEGLHRLRETRAGDSQAILLTWARPDHL